MTREQKKESTETIVMMKADHQSRRLRTMNEQTNQGLNGILGIQPISTTGTLPFLDIKRLFNEAPRIYSVVRRRLVATPLATKQRQEIVLILAITIVWPSAAVPQTFERVQC